MAIDDLTPIFDHIITQLRRSQDLKKGGVYLQSFKCIYEDKTFIIFAINIVFAVLNMRITNISRVVVNISICPGFVSFLQKRGGPDLLDLPL